MLRAGIARISAERTRWLQPHGLVETDCLLLVGARFEAQDRLAGLASLVHDLA
jgi:hypothetical protein